MNRVRYLVLNAALGPLDYKVPEGMDVGPGSVVECPLGPRTVIGIVWEAERLAGTEVPAEKLRPLRDVLPDRAKLPAPGAGGGATRTQYAELIARGSVRPCANSTWRQALATLRDDRAGGTDADRAGAVGRLGMAVGLSFMAGPILATLLVADYERALRERYAIGIVGAGDFEKQQGQLGGAGLRDAFGLAVAARTPAKAAATARDRPRRPPRTLRVGGFRRRPARCGPSSRSTARAFSSLRR